MVFAKIAEALNDGAERKAYATLIAGAAAMLLAMPLSAKMGALDHALMRLLPWLFALPPDLLRWFLLILTAAMMAWAGRGIYLSAVRGLRHGTHQYEHAGQPGNRRGLCLFRLRDDLARGRPPGLLRRGSVDYRLSSFGQSAGRPREAPRTGRAGRAFAAEAGHCAAHSRRRCRLSFRWKRFSSATACWCCPGSASRWTRRFCRDAENRRGRLLPHVA